MSIVMDLERNLIDNILECEVKLGHASMPISFYYPISSLKELLDCDETTLVEAIATFQHKEESKLGKVVIEELENEKGRYGVTVPASGVDWASSNFTASDFMKEFIVEIKRPGNTLDDMVKLFARYSDEINIDKQNSEEWGISFKDETIDPYVYYIEQNAFGLEYHRFTRKAYLNTIVD